MFQGFDSRIEWHSPELASLVAAGALPRGRALDVGCGHGTEALFLAARGWNVVAIDRSAAAIRTAQKRRLSLPPLARRRVQFIRRGATTFRERTPGTFAVVIDRLFFNNLGPAERKKLLRIATHALYPDGVFVLRTAPAGVLKWGRGGHLFTIRERHFLRQYFEWSKHVSYTALVTDPSQQDGALVVTTRPQSIAVLRRNGVPLKIAHRRAAATRASTKAK